MANIETVRLPDGTVYNVADAISGYASKVTGGTDGDLVNLDANGDIADSGWKTTALEALVNVYGSKNLNVYPYEDTTKTTNGITFTDKGDGSIKVGDSTAQTATANAQLYCQQLNSNPVYLKNGTYELSGCPAGGSESTFRVVVNYKDTNNANVYVYSYGGDTEFTINGSYGDANGAYIRTYIQVISGATIDAGGITFKPMIRDARIKDATFVPYAMTNQEITKAIKGDVIVERVVSFNNTTTTDTVQARLNDVALQALTYIQSLSANESAEISHFTARTITFTMEGASVKYTNQATSISARGEFWYINPSTQKAFYYHGRIHTMLANCECSSVTLEADPKITFQDLASGTNGNGVTCEVTVYKTI